MSRATPSYELRLPAKDAPAFAATSVLSAQHPRYGHARIRVFVLAPWSKATALRPQAQVQ